jgi:integrase
VWTIVERQPDHVRDLIRFLLLVPLRREEAQGLLWSEVDLGENRILIRAERTKNRQPHCLPLPEPALVILAKRASNRIESTDGRVFASPSRARTINWDYCVTRIRAAIGEGDVGRQRRFNLHDIRRAFVSHLAERGFDVDLLDQCLSHTRRGVLGVYQRASRMRERQTALNAWADLVTGAQRADNIMAIHA